jgi:gliding motility-associated-like protein
MAVSFQLKAQTIIPPLITHISIDSISNQVEIVWANSSPETEGYIIYKKDYFGLWTPLDTILGIENTYYKTNNSTAQLQIETYSVTAFDGNDNSSLRSDFHETMQLENEYQLCDDSCRLNWNSYHNMFALNGYLLQVNTQNTQNGQTDFIQYDLGVNDTDITIPIDYSNQYKIYVVAYNALDSFATSSRVEFTSTDLTAPSYIYLNKVTVKSDEEVEINIISDSSDVSYYEVFRSNYQGQTPFKIGETDPVNSPNKFIDSFVFPDIKEYYYSAVAVDRCNNKSRRTKESSGQDSSIVNNLLLESDSIDLNQINLRWGNYDGFLNPFVTFELWKDINGTREFISDIQSNSETTIELAGEIGKICYFVKSYEQYVNSIDRQDTIHSNSICFNNIPKIYIPSAFTPNEDFKNNNFKVEIYDNGSLERYKMRVYDLYGRLVFYSENENLHWDGTFNNKILPIDTYVYIMELSYGGDQVVTKKGNITLLR